MDPYVQGDDPVYYGFDNDKGQIAMVALHNNDLANFWEWYGSPNYPLKPSTDAFRLGTVVGRLPGELLAPDGELHHVQLCRRRPRRVLA